MKYNWLFRGVVAPSPRCEKLYSSRPLRAPSCPLRETRRTTFSVLFRLLNLPSFEVALILSILKTFIMSNFKRSDLQYDYSWSADGDDNPSLRGNPDSSLLDRTEGYEVLYMINKFLDKKGSSSVALGKRCETAIKTTLPGNTRSQYNVMEWLMGNVN